MDECFGPPHGDTRLSHGFPRNSPNGLLARGVQRGAWCLNPVEFFRQTFLTVGWKDLLPRSLLRLIGKGRDPVVELQTNFGGGRPIP